MPLCDIGIEGHIGGREANIARKNEEIIVTVPNIKKSSVPLLYRTHRTKERKYTHVNPPCFSEFSRERTSKPSLGYSFFITSIADLKSRTLTGVSLPLTAGIFVSAEIVMFFERSKKFLLAL